ncbi:hypothetical protein [Rhodococcus jostii]|uniref:hypothetical protein n=1 Tax=Rhodococcus jostii TaxID=132919 RepID=UPI00363F424B
MPDLGDAEQMRGGEQDCRPGEGAGGQFDDCCEWRVIDDRGDGGDGGDGEGCGADTERGGGEDPGSGAGGVGGAEVPVAAAQQ